MLVTNRSWFLFSRNAKLCLYVMVFFLFYRIMLFIIMPIKCSFKLVVVSVVELSFVTDF